MAIGIDGLISGLDTTSLINQLVEAESGERTQLETRSSSVSKLVTSLQSLNTKLASLTDAATASATASSWQAYTATSSSSAVTVAARAGATSSSLSLTTTALARGQVSLVDTSALAGQTSLTFFAADGTATTVDIDGDTPASAAQAINAAGIGISAALVRVGGSGDDAEFVLQLTGATGAAGAFSARAGDTEIASASSAITTAQDAEVVLWAGTGAERRVTSATNTFEDLLAGTDITVSAVSADPVTITVGADTDAQAALVTDLVAKVADVLSAISAGTATTTSTDDDGNTVVSGGVYAGDSAVRALSQDLVEAFTRPVDGVSPATALGISVDRDGAITIDESVLAASLAADPEGTQAFATALSARVAQVGTTYSDPISGLITSKISGQQTLSADLEARISEWDTRIADRKASLLTKFNAMETTLATLKTTSSWLDTQLAGLMTNYSGSKS
jgi:flagellar hook-associated protein 2